MTETRGVTWWAIFEDNIDLLNLNSSFQEINNDILILLQTSTSAIYLTIQDIKINEQWLLFYFPYLRGYSIMCAYISVQFNWQQNVFPNALQ